MLKLLYEDDLRRLNVVNRPHHKKKKKKSIFYYQKNQKFSLRENLGIMREGAIPEAQNGGRKPPIYTTILLSPYHWAPARPATATSTSRWVHFPLARNLALREVPIMRHDDQQQDFSRQSRNT